MRYLLAAILFIGIKGDILMASDPVAVQENERRIFRGEDPLLPGLRCTAHNLVMNVLGIPPTPPAPSSSFIYRGAFNERNISPEEGLAIIPEPFRSRYTSWFMFICHGIFISETNEQFHFTVTSDDGVKLSIDSNVLIDEWTRNVPHVSTSDLFLNRGIHAIQIIYFQSTGNQTVVIEDQYGVIEANRFLH